MAAAAIALFSILTCGVPALAAGLSSANGVDQYSIDVAASDIRVLVYRTGLLSNLAHDHVMVAREFSGIVSLAPGHGRGNSADMSSSGNIEVQVSSLEVDAPEARRAEGLSGTLDAEDRAEIRAIMLGQEMLNAAQHPVIRVKVLLVDDLAPLTGLTVRIRIRGVEREYIVMARVRRTGGQIRISGDFQLKQTDFGIAPYSTFLGTIAVADRVKIKFDVVARRQP